MTPKQAWLAAAQWGSFMQSGDPGACMYGFRRIRSRTERESTANDASSGLTITVCRARASVTRSRPVYLVTVNGKGDSWSEPGAIVV
jgi:hypothetical protein